MFNTAERYLISGLSIYQSNKKKEHVLSLFISPFKIFIKIKNLKSIQHRLKSKKNKPKIKSFEDVTIKL